MSTSDSVIAALAAYDLKIERNGKYRCNSPFRPGSNSHGFTLTITDPEHGAWFDHVSHDSGTLYQLAEKLGIEVPNTQVENTKRGFSGINDYAKAHGITGEILAAAKWYETTYKDRRALAFPTKTGTRWRFLDGNKPYYISGKSYQRCWYGLNATAMQRLAAGQPLVICNGEISTIAAQHHGLAATAITGGEHDIPPHLLDELKLFLGDLKPEIIIAMDCDATGKRVAKQVENHLTAVGYRAKAVDLGLGSGGDLADFCKLYTDQTIYLLVNMSPVPDIVLTDNSQNRTWYITHAKQLRDLPPVEWILPGQIPSKGLAVIYGESGSGKSFIALDHALSIAQEQPVIYMACEGEFGYPQRIAAWCKHHQKDEGSLYMCMGAVEMMETSDLAAFLSAGETINPCVVFVDTLARAMIGGDENNQRDMGFFITACEEIQRHWACAVLVIHHTNKGGRVERGSNVLRGSADVMTRVSMVDNIILVECEKTKDAEPFDSYNLRLNPITVDIGGQECQIPVVMAAEKVIQTTDDKLTISQKKVMNVLKVALFSDGATAQDLMEITNLNRSTVYSVLNTLMSLGFVAQSAPREPYKITESGQKMGSMSNLSKLSNSSRGVLDNNKKVIGESPSDNLDNLDNLDNDDLVQFGRDGLGAEVTQLPLDGDDSKSDADAAPSHYEAGL
jgi:predicted transcriptional regulator